jgi:ABC-type glutathione transport system ATPase component
VSGDAPLLQVRDLEVHYRRGRVGWLGRGRDPIKAVDGITFDVPEGETLGLVGESGSGKSTTALAILRLVRPTGGSVRFAGVDVATLEGDELRRSRRDIQMIFQDPYSSLDPRMRVAAIIEEPLRVHGIGSRAERATEVEHLLELVGLDRSVKTRRPREFSGGQRQRIAIARALALKPRCIICDEPVSALDLSVQAQIANLLRDLQDELHLTFVFISHDLGVVKVMSDWIAVMHEGKIVELGEATKVYSEPQHEYTRKLLAAVPVPDVRLGGERRTERRRRQRETAALANGSDGP